MAIILIIIFCIYFLPAFIIVFFDTPIYKNNDIYSPSDCKIFSNGKNKITRQLYDNRKVPVLIFSEDHSINNQVLYLKGEEWPTYNWNYRKMIESLEKGIIKIQNK